MILPLAEIQTFSFMKEWTTSFQGTFYILLGEKNLQEKRLAQLRNEVLQIVVETSYLFFTKQKLYIIPLNKKII